MDSVTIQEALKAIDTASITPDQVASLVETGDTKAVMVSASKVKTAAAYKQLDIYKVVKARVILPSSGETYVNMVKEAASRLGSDEDDIENYTSKSDTYFTHTDVYPLCEGKKDPSKKYLYCIYEDTAAPIYIKDGVEITKAEVASYLTASAATSLLDEKPKVTENVTHGIKHDVAIRTLSLGNVISLENSLTEA